MVWSSDLILLRLSIVEVLVCVFDLEFWSTRIEFFGVPFFRYVGFMVTSARMVMAMMTTSWMLTSMYSRVVRAGQDTIGQLWPVYYEVSDAIDIMHTPWTWLVSTLLNAEMRWTGPPASWSFWCMRTNENRWWSCRCHWCACVSASRKLVTKEREVCSVADRGGWPGMCQCTHPRFTGISAHSTSTQILWHHAAGRLGSCTGFTVFTVIKRQKKNVQVRILRYLVISKLIYQGMGREDVSPIVSTWGHTISSCFVCACLIWPRRGLNENKQDETEDWVLRKNMSS